MTQTNVDDQFLNGLHLMIDSIESSYLEKADDADDNAGEDDLPEADHWCPDVQAWHTADHESAQAPSVHVNVGQDNGDDSSQSENGSDTGAWEDASKDEDLEKISVAATLKDVEHGIDRIESEYDQNTNLDRQEQENSPDSIAEPFLNRYAVRDDEEGEEEEEEDIEKARAGGIPPSLQGQNIKPLTGPINPVTPEQTARGEERKLRQNPPIPSHWKGSYLDPAVQAEKQKGKEDGVAKQWEAEEHEQEAGENIDIAPRGKGVATEARGRQGRLPKAAQRLPATKHEFADFDRDIKRGEHADAQPDSYESVEKSLDNSNDFIEALVRTHAKSIDILKIWGSVDRVLPKTSSDAQLLTDIDILKSFDLDETTNIENLIEGTLVHKMLVDRTSRPTAEWWKSSMLIAKAIDTVAEPAFFSAFLYYEPDTFDVTDFIELAEVTRGKPQDLEMMPNTSGGSAIDGLGMSADGVEPGPKDDDCDD